MMLFRYDIFDVVALNFLKNFCFLKFSIYFCTLKNHSLRMKRRLLYIIAAAMLLQVAVSSCKKDDEEQSMMTLTVTLTEPTVHESIRFYLKGSGTAVIDWGDGLPYDTITLSDTGDTRCERPYSGLINREIKIYGDGITSLDFSTSLNIFNKLTSLDVSKNPALTSLNCFYNQITVLDVSRNTALTHLDCGDNRLTVLDVSRNTALTYLSCSYNRLTVLDVSRNSALELLNCDDNRLTVLDVSKNTALTFLSCDDNQLTGLDVSKNTALTLLSCRNKLLTGLDVSKNTALEYLSTTDSPLERLDVSRNTALEILWCVRNQLSAVALNALFGTLHSSTILGKIIHVYGNPGSDACNPSIATEKGWIVRTEIN